MKYIQSPNFTPWYDKKNLLIVIHWIAGFSAQAVNWFLNPSSKASAHYLIDHCGGEIQMVDEKDVAWHCGTSELKDYPTFGVWKSLNPCSIGIELAGPPSCLALQGWNEKEILTLIELCKEIAIRNPGIKLTDHYTVDASGQGKIDVRGTKNKIDVFPWEKLIEETGIEEA